MVSPKDVKCEQVWREISNYLEGEVDPGCARRWTSISSTCQKCKSVLEGTRNVIQLYSDERMIEVPAGFGRRLERRLAQSDSSSQPADGRHGRRGWFRSAALALIAGGLRVANSLTVPHPLQSEHAQPGRDIPPDMVVVVSAGAKEFHAPGCGVIHNKDTERTLTAKEAIRARVCPLRAMHEEIFADRGGRTHRPRNGS